MLSTPPVEKFITYPQATKKLSTFSTGFCGKLAKKSNRSFCVPRGTFALKAVQNSAKASITINKEKTHYWG